MTAPRDARPVRRMAPARRAREPQDARQRPVHTHAWVRASGAAGTGGGPRPCGCRIDPIVFGHRPACGHGGSVQRPLLPSGAAPGLAR